MKKLIVAAAACAMVGAAFANCDYTPKATGTAWVYNWKFTGKTTVGALTGAVDPQINACDWAGGVAACVIRVPGSLAIKGYSYNCDPECVIDNKNEFINLANWTIPGEFYMTKPYKDLLSAEPTIDVANVIGRAGGKFELAGNWKFTSKGLPNEEFDLDYAGMGTYNASKQRVTSVSGSFCGKAKTPYYIPTASVIKAAAKEGIVDSLCLPAIVWDCAVARFIDDDTSVAYGTWSVKYNADASAKYYERGTRVKLPSWAK